MNLAQAILGAKVVQQMGDQLPGCIPVQVLIEPLAYHQG